jgi:hypothetical protein
VERLIEHRIPFVVHSGDHPSMHADTPFAHGRWVNKPADEGILVEAARATICLKRLDERLLRVGPLRSGC